jgi:hypothetical protein
VRNVAPFRYVLKGLSGRPRRFIVQHAVTRSDRGSTTSKLPQQRSGPRKLGPASWSPTHFRPFEFCRCPSSLDPGPDGATISDRPKSNMASQVVALTPKASILGNFYECCETFISSQALRICGIVYGAGAMISLRKGLDRVISCSRKPYNAQRRRIAASVSVQNRHRV